MDWQAIETEPKKDFSSPREVCRLCLSKEILNDVFGEEDLHQWISNYLSITVSIEDPISKAICAMCRIQLTEFHHFRIRSQEVQAILKTMVEKLEDNESNKVSETIPALKGMQCEVCHKMFRSRKLLMSHKKIHEPRKHICTKCGKLFARRQHLIKHMETHVNDNKKNEDISAAEPSEVKLEPFEEHEAPPMVARDYVQDTLTSDTTCQEEMAEISCFIVNEESEQTHNTRKGETIQRSKEAATVQSNEKLALSSQPEKVKETSIDKQNNLYRKTYKLGKTMRTHKKKTHGIKELSCAICERPFAYKNAMKKHLLTHRSIEERQQTKPDVDVDNDARPFECDICQKAFKRKAKIWDHKKRVHGPRTHECVICGFRFTMRDDLAKHLQKHERNGDRKEDFRSLQLYHRNNDKGATTGKRRDASSIIQIDQKLNALPAECQECQKVFKSQKYLWLHYQWVHKPRTSKCPICNVAYTTKIHLEKHMLTKHSQEDDQPPKCPVCNKIFSDKSQMKRHTENHGPRKYCCSVCNKTFAVLKNLESHKRRHNDLASTSDDKQCSEKNRSSSSSCRKKASKNRHQKHKPNTIQEEIAESNVAQQERGGAPDRDSGSPFQEPLIEFEAEEYKIEPE